LQAAALATFVAVPLLTTQVAPRGHDRLTVFLPHETPAPVIESSGPEAVSTTSSALVLRQPRTIDPLARGKPYEEVPLSLHQVGVGKTGPAMPDLFNHTVPQVVLHAAEPKPPIVSVLQEGVVISRIQPVYPHL